MQKKAFTLIELLVVIAIIGILAGIVIVSTRSAILKAKDSQVQSALAQAKQIAEMIMNDNGNYNALCLNGDINTGGTYSDQLTKIRNQIASAQGVATPIIACQASGNNYCVSAKLVSTSSHYCVDNTGYAGLAGDPGTTGCDATNYTCAAD